jgi:hypothetical protein
MSKFAIRSFAIFFILMSVVACSNPAVDITNRAMDSRDASSYNEYLKNAGQINLEREKAGLAPSPIMSRAEWSGKK